jgi:peptidoglycan/LPS O-acetylase OafA/YrhL
MGRGPFFVVSDFIICYVTEESGKHFFAKRVIGIVPLYWAGTISVFCVALTVPHLLINTTTSVNYDMFFYLLFAISMAASHRYPALHRSFMGLSGVKLPRGVLLIGEASYSLYLFHPYVLRLLATVFRFFSGHPDFMIG